MDSTGASPAERGDRKRAPGKPGDRGLKRRLEELERALTEKAWTETALLEKEARLRLVVEQMPAILWATDADLRFTSALGAGLAALNLRPNSVVGMNLFEYFKTNDAAFMPIAAHRLALHGESLAYEMEWMGRVYQSYVEPLRDKDGTVIGTVCSSLDITARKRAEDSVREREERLRLIAEQMPAVVWSTDNDLRFTSSLGAGLAALNLRPNQVVGMSLFEYFRTTDLEFPAVAAHRRALKGETVAYELEWEGRAFQNYVEPLRDPGGAVIGTIGVAMDITERLRAEKEARSWAEVIRLTRAGVAIADAESNVFAMANPAFAEMHGWSVGELVGRQVSEVFAPEELEKLPDHLRQVHEKGFHIYESVHVRRDGTTFPVLTHSQAVRDESGRVAQWVATVLDITEQKHAREESRRSERRFRSIIENSWDAVALVGPDGRILYASPSTRRVLGYAPEELIGRSGEVLGLGHAEDREALRGASEEFMRSPGKVITAESRVRHKDGSWRWMEMTASNLLDEPGLRAVILNYRDITGLKQALENRLRLAAVVESSRDAIYTRSPDGTLTSWNRGAEEMFGYSAGEAVGKPASMLAPPELAAEMADIMERLKRGERIAPFETVRVRKDGTPVHVSLSVSPIRDSAGRLVAASAIARDISDQKKKERLKEQLREWLEERERESG